MSQYTDEFKKQIVNLYNNEKAPSEIIKKYKIARKRGKYRRKKAFINFCSQFAPVGWYKKFTETPITDAILYRIIHDSPTRYGWNHATAGHHGSFNRYI